MRNPLLMLLLLFSVIGCNEKVEVGPPNAEVKELEKDFKTWWRYHNKEIMLSSEFVGLNENSQKVSKGSFLKSLMSGDFIPIKIESFEDQTYYMLFELSTEADESIKETISTRAKYQNDNFRLEGTRFPEFQMTDLDGNAYSTETVQGKTLVVKLWFIGCTACVAEFPELNELVHQRDDEETLFLSLVLDDQEKLEKFLERKPFEYKVVAEQKEFIHDQLNVSAFPTHIVVDKNGIILKVVDKSKELIHFLEG